MSSIKLKINSEEHVIDVDPKMPLLWVVRDVLGLTGTKFGCGIAQCGACTVHLDGNAVRSCTLAVSQVGTKSITTIEGLAKDSDHPVQRAWIMEQVPQCGYCQSGMIMTTAALLKRKPNPSDADINAALNGHICRCGTYPRIRNAIKGLTQGQ